MNKEDEKIILDSATMTDKDMKNLLVELSRTKYWQAIIRFNRSVDVEAIGSLASIDPFKEPTSMAKTQGIRIGIYKIEKEVEREIEERKRIESGRVDEVKMPTYS